MIKSRIYEIGEIREKIHNQVSIRSFKFRYPLFPTALGLHPGRLDKRQCLVFGEASTNGISHALIPACHSEYGDYWSR